MGSALEKQTCEALWTAIDQGNAGEVRNILTVLGAAKVKKLLVETEKRDPEAHNQYGNGFAALHRLCWVEDKNGKQMEVFKVLKEFNVDVNMKCPDRFNWTPLHIAAQRASLAFIKELIASDASPYFLDNNVDTPLRIACRLGRFDVVKYLIEETSSDPTNTLCGPAALGDCKLIEYLLEHKASVNAVDRDSRTPLVHAVVEGKVDAVKLLLAAKADLQVQDWRGSTAYELSKQFNHDEITKMLLEAAGGEKAAVVNEPSVAEEVEMTI